MKNRFKLLGIIVFAAVTGFTLTACANGTTDNDDDNSGAYVSYFGSDSLGNGYILEIGSGVPKAGDSYEFTKITPTGSYKSVGTVSSDAKASYGKCHVRLAPVVPVSYPTAGIFTMFMLFV
jgi:hypothetical protein